MTRGSLTWLRGAGAAAAGLIIAACIIQQEPAPTALPANQGGGGPPGGADPVVARGLADGDYSCSIQDSGYQYPPFRCVVYRGENGGQVLEKMGGSQRFRGLVVEDGDGFRFDGTFYCPMGDCTENVSGTFARAGDGGYRGTLDFASGRQSPVVVSLQLTPGGFGYGGGTYGGAGYAAPPPPPAPAPAR